MLKAIDGYEKYLNRNDMFARTGFLTYAPFGLGAFGGIVTPGRGGYGSCYLEQSTLSTFGTFAPTFADKNDYGVIGIACNAVSSFSPPAADGLVMAFYDTVANDQQFIVHFLKSNGSVLIYAPGTLFSGEFVPGGTLVYTSPPNVWKSDTWNFYPEVKCVIHPTAGSVTVRVNNVVVASVSNVQTQKTANRWFDQIQFGHPWFGTSDFQFDDFYYCDGVPGPGPIPFTDFLGNIRVYTQFMIANDGSQQWTPLSGSNFSNVNEIYMDSDTSYVSTSTPGHEDLYVVPRVIPLTSHVAALQITSSARMDDAGPHQLVQGFRTGLPPKVLGPGHAMTSGYQYFSDLYVTNPNTGKAFTKREMSELSALIRMAS